jgi:hypothetical protein
MVGALSPKVKRPELKADYLNVVPRLRMSGDIPAPPVCLGVMHKDHFIFNLPDRSTAVPNLT